MSIKFSLQHLPLSTDPNDFRAIVQAGQIFDEESIIKECLLRGTSLTEPDLRAVINLLFTVIGDKVAGGNFVNTSLVNLRPSILGKFNGAADGFDANRHHIGATASAGTVLKAKMSNANVEKVEGGLPSPNIIQYTNLRDGSSAIANKGGGGKLLGSQLKFTVANVNEGVFFVHQGDNVATRVTEYLSLTEGEVIFIIPTSLTPGQYHIEVRRAYTQANVIRKDQWDTLLNVI
ncbi:MAG: DUF4469 domain-containing protein [Bacteroidetes bacterium]|nr:DUF4469 domain-containing protein [Bacteroidota bacterium]